MNALRRWAAGWISTRWPRVADLLWPHYSERRRRGWGD